MLVASSAHAGETVSIKTPLGQTISAEKVSNPAKGTIEHHYRVIEDDRDGQFMHGEKHTATQRGVIRILLGNK